MHTNDEGHPREEQTDTRTEQDREQSGTYLEGDNDGSVGVDFLHHRHLVARAVVAANLHTDTKHKPIAMGSGRHEHGQSVSKQGLQVRT
jgi:hypothetical protein